MRYQVRCPLCGAMQVMDDERIISIDAGASAKAVAARQLARYRCAACEGLWSDMQRDLALRNGKWTVEEGSLDGATAVAFHLRLWESTLVSLSTVLSEKMRASNDPRLLQIYENNVRARPYRFISTESSEEKLAAYIDHDLAQGIVPDWALALTLSADMQQDHFWFSVAAHGIDPERLHILDYGRIAEWSELTDLIFQSRYRTAGGREFGIWRAALDTGGGKKASGGDTRPMQAQKWLSMQRPGVVFGTKGMSRETPGVFVKVSLPDRAGAKTRTAALRSTLSTCLIRTTSRS